MIIEKLNPTHLDSLRAMDHEMDNVDRLNSLEIKSAMDWLYLEASNKEAFEHYYHATRDIVMEEGKIQDIVIDDDIKLLANLRLKDRGYPQLVKHQEVINADKLLEKVFK